ncbi:MAG: hypothetical protein LBH58_09830 [Tannerellaceae bacterium]|jgi:hypothetical protein|nr:hypothetical protein [Tannerellaceae bacterium]
METSRITNKQLRESIDKYVDKYPICRKTSEMPLLWAWLEFADIISGAKEIEKRYLDDFVFGLLVTLPLASKKPEYEEWATKLTNPVFDVIRDYINNGHQESLVDRSLDQSFLTKNELVSPITKNGVLGYIKRHNICVLTDEEMKQLIIIYEQEKRFNT